jgi:multiple sugar transport system permease protein
VTLLLIGAAFVLLPLAIVLLTSLAPTGTSATSGNLAPKGLTLVHYRQAWASGNFLLAFANSTVVALAVTGFQVITSALAGYALARLKFRGRQALLLLILATLVIPFQILVVPIFLVLKWGHLINTYGALISAHSRQWFRYFSFTAVFPHRACGVGRGGGTRWG